MRRREFLAGLGSAAAWPVAARAQQRALPVIGYLSTQSADEDYKNITVSFLQGLKEAGYVEGQNVAIEYRWAENQLDRLPALVADLVRRGVAVIVAGGDAAALAAKAATTTIPIVFVTGSDPVALGLVASLNRPGANLTGSVNLAAELAPKQLQLLRELLPNAARFGFLADPASPPTQSALPDLQTAARTLGLELVVVNARTAISQWPSQVFRNSALVRSWSATVPSSAAAWNNSRRWRPAMRCPRSTHTVSTPSPAV
jgi:putative tryptophan/tyrosine transport system substrate-binding protein